MERIVRNGKSSVSTITLQPSPSAILGRLDSSVKQSEQKAGSYWKVYFFLQYILCVCPFRLSKVSSQRSKDGLGVRSLYRTESLQVQKILCVVVGVAALFGICGDLRRSLPKDTSNPTLYFEMAQTMSYSCGKFFMLKRYWFDEVKILKLVNLVMSTELGTMTNAPLLRRIVASRYTFLTLCVVYCLNELAYTMLDMGAGEGIGFLWHNMVDDARYNYFMHKMNYTSASFETQGSGGDLVIGILTLINFYQKIVMGAFDNLYVLAAILTLWTMTTSFVQYVMEEQMIATPRLEELILNTNHGDKVGNGGVKCPWWPTFFYRYRCLRRASDGINVMFGTNVTMILNETIVFLAVALQGLFYQISGHGKGDWFRSVLTCIVLVVIVVTCILAADIEHKLFKVRKLVAQPANRHVIPYNELEYILDDTEQSGLSIKASNTYAITYNLLANVAGTIVTYFIICLGV